MIDLFMTAVGIFGIFLLPFLMIRYLKIFNLMFLFVTFILALVLLSTSENYEELDLWENSVYNPIRKTKFLPIKRIKAFKLSDGEYDFDLIKTDGIFSIVKNDEYSKECLENYFIRSTNECPITDLKFKKGLSQSHILIDYDEQQIDDGLYTQIIINLVGVYIQVYLFTLFLLIKLYAICQIKLKKMINAMKL